MKLEVSEIYKIIYRNARLLQGEQWVDNKETNGLAL